MVKTSDAILTGLPIVNFAKDNFPAEACLDYTTNSELVGFSIYLTERERYELIVAFEKDRHYRGVLPLYSMNEIRRLRGLFYKPEASS